MLRQIGRKVLVGLIAVAGVGSGVTAGAIATATAAHAGVQVLDGPSVEICKLSVAGPLAVTGSFTFTISGNYSSGDTLQTYSVAVGYCTQPIAVSGSQVTITEASAPWYQVASITEAPGQSYIPVGGVNLSAGSVTVNTDPTGSTVDVVNFTNQLILGNVEVCKNVAAGSNLTGAFSFNVTGADGWTASPTVTILPGQTNACSMPIPMPAGTVTTSEQGANQYITGIVAAANTGSAKNVPELQPGANLVTGVATENVLPANGTANETIITYTDDVVGFKVCKSWDWSTGNPASMSTTYPITTTVAPGGSVVDGALNMPNALPIGSCTQPAYFRAGTTLTITEGIVPGTKVVDMSPTDGVPAESVVPASTSLTSRTTSIIVGTPTTSGVLNPGSEAVVTVTNGNADPGALKICKSAGTPGPVGTSFTFNLTNTADGSSLGSVVVPLGGCAEVGGSLSPTLFPFNTTIMASEVSNSANNLITTAVSDPTMVYENVGTICFPGAGPTATSEPVVSNINTTPFSANSVNYTGSVDITIGEDTTSVVTVTNIDPPLTTSGGSGSNGSTNVGVPTGGGVVNVVIPSAGSGASITPVVTAGTHTSLTAKQKAALLKVDSRKLSHLNSQIALERRLIHKAHGTRRAADVRRLNALLAQTKALRFAMSLLK